MASTAKKKGVITAWRTNRDAWLPCTVVTSSDPSEYRVAVELPNYTMPMSSYVRRDDVRITAASGQGWVRVTVVDRERHAGRDYVVVRFPGETEWRGPLTPVPPSYLDEHARPDEPSD